MVNPELDPEDGQRAKVTAFLTAYVAASHQGVIDCILAQDDWQYIGAQSEKYRAMAADEAMAAEAEGFAMSALVECHSGPHLPTCPDLQ